MARSTTQKPVDRGARDIPDEPEVADASAAPDAQALRKRLLTRVAVAAVMIAALLGVLTLFDKINAPPRKVASAPPAPQAQATPPPVAEAPAAMPVPDAPVPAEDANTVDKLAAEIEMSDAPVTPQSRPERPLTKPATGRLAMQKRSEPIVAARPAHPAAVLAQPSRPLTHAAVAQRVYVLQLGVFNNVANAEELRAKLELNGIPSQIEARVQVGPFKTRQEADAARDKLKALGMEAGMVVAQKKQ